MKDMNEPANFDTNGVEAWNWPDYLEPWALNCTFSKWDDPPYRPSMFYFHVLKINIYLRFFL